MCTLHTMLAFVVFGCGEVVGGKRTKTNMMAICYNLKYLQSDNWKILNIFGF